MQHQMLPERTQAENSENVIKLIKPNQIMMSLLLLNLAWYILYTEVEEGAQKINFRLDKKIANKPI